MQLLQPLLLVEWVECTKIHLKMFYFTAGYGIIISGAFILSNTIFEVNYE